IGISSGASAAGVICIVFFGMSQSAVSAISLCASLAVALLIYLLAYRGGFSAMRLIVTGIGIAAMLNSLVSYSLSKADSWDLPTATRWLTGSLNGATWDRAMPLIVTTVVLIPLLVANARNVDLMRLGNDSAVGLGVATNRTRVIAIIAAVALIAVATAACGPIAFVAFVSGPIAARLLGSGGAVTISAALLRGRIAL